MNDILIHIGYYEDGCITIDELKTKVPALANLTVAKMIAGNTPTPFYLAANDLSNSLRRSK